MNIKAKISNLENKAERFQVDFSSQLHMLFDTGSREVLINQVLKQNKQINQRYYRLEKAGKQYSSYAYQTSQKELDTQSKPRYTTNKKVLENMSDKELLQMGLETSQKLFSKTSTIRGIEYVEENRVYRSYEKMLETFGLNENDVNYEDYKKFLDDEGGELMNQYDSTELQEDFLKYTQEGNLSVKQFLREFKRYTVNKVDFGRVRRSLNNIARKKKH